jgi:hypothetical protein
VISYIVSNAVKSFRKLLDTMSASNPRHCIPVDIKRGASFVDGAMMVVQMLLSCIDKSILHQKYAMMCHRRVSCVDKTAVLAMQ